MDDIRFKSGGPLGMGYSRFFNAWLESSAGSGATAELSLALSRETPLAGQLFSSGWTPPKVEMESLSPARAQRMQDNLAALAVGRAAVVVTGQQPGFGGGPLYTLYKIATTVALAEQRTRNGLATIPVFWSGDDDSDLHEALSAVFWHPDDNRLHLSGGRSLLPRARLTRRMVGTFPCGDICRWSAGWLAAMATRGDDPLVADLARIHRMAIVEGWSLSRLNTAVWYRCFEHSNLLVVSGNDPQLHAAAAPFTATIREQTPSLVAQARGQGRELANQGWHVQLTERSLRSPWYKVVGDQRLPLGEKENVPAAYLRPGVLVRSLIQDWLLAPVAVVVGPGEYAYLRQLESLYQTVGLRRSSLVPRLAGRLIPEGWAGCWEQLSEDSATLAVSWAQNFIADSQVRLTALLETNLGLDPIRSQKLAAGRTRRWERGLSAMLTGLARDHNHSAALPVWACPGGKNQERTLAAFNALGLWGSALSGAIFQGAAAHIAQGSVGKWLAMAWEIPNSGVKK